MLTVALKVPEEDGVNVTTKVVKLPPATGDAGCADTVYPAPVTVTVPG